MKRVIFVLLAFGLNSNLAFADSGSQEKPDNYRLSFLKGYKDSYNDGFNDHPRNAKASTLNLLLQLGIKANKTDVACGMKALEILSSYGLNTLTWPALNPVTNIAGDSAEITKIAMLYLESKEAQARAKDPAAQPGPVTQVRAKIAKILEEDLNCVKSLQETNDVLRQLTERFLDQKSSGGILAQAINALDPYSSKAFMESLTFLPEDSAASRASVALPPDEEEEE